ncbi:PTS fructose transporter subunit IIA [Acidovorax sp. GBBC 3334]|uniref:PTS sugar transporter subunit IIA n=1 Tax=unclassified Acidovorax TaxID=2684926 RepID=UPI002303906F|nr:MULTISPECIES: PTS fructose transporter subunit IIA [unclassified Acidovorax]MDA8456647.1 PTS fructose transporter subunit IIA [Acidovorax sp. GBBC 3334]MDA8522965.1 PTS fructose transporter subunit IIA [Acidovorax sp. NCPPB 4044]
MSTRILLIAHAPLAHALRACALHVFPDSAEDILALDVHPNAPPEDTLSAARILLEGGPADGTTLVLTDVFGATPCNVAQRLVDGEHSRLVTGVNLPMLLRTVSYRREPLDALVSRAVVGGTQGVMQVAAAAPQNQTRRPHHDQDDHHHQQ